MSSNHVEHNLIMVHISILWWQRKIICYFKIWSRSHWIEIVWGFMELYLTSSVIMFFRICLLTLD